MGAGAVRSLLRDGPVFAGASALQLVSVTIAIPVITRLLGTERYGALAVALVVSQTVGVIAGLGLPASATREFFVGSDDSATGLGRSVAVVVGAIATSVAFTVVAHLSAPLWIRAFDNVPYDATMQIAVVSAVPATTLYGAQALLRAQRAAYRFVATAIGAAVGGQVVGLALLASGGGTTAYLGSVVVATGVAGAVGLLWSARGSFAMPGRVLFADAVRIGAPTVPHALAIVSLAIGDRLVIERHLGLDGVGRYQVAYAAAAIGIRGLVALNNAWGPIYYAARPEEETAVLTATTIQVTWLAAILTGSLAIAAPAALQVLAPASYEPTGLTAVTAVAALATLPYAQYIAGAHPLFKAGRTLVFAWASPLVAVANLALAWLLVGPLGLVGASISSVAAYALLAMLVRWRAVAAGLPMYPVRMILAPYSVGVSVALGSIAAPTGGHWLFGRAAAATLMAAGLTVAVMRRGLMRAPRTD